MEIEEGQVWRRRDGTTTRIVRVLDSASKFAVLDDAGFVYGVNGNYREDCRSHPHDLVELTTPTWDELRAAVSAQRRNAKPLNTDEPQPAADAWKDSVVGSGTVYMREPTPKAPEILEAAAGHMRDRAATYDKPEGERSMAATVAAFNAQTGRDLTEAEGWLLMVNLKIVRDRQRAPHKDSLEDLTAYSALMAEARLAE